MRRASARGLAALLAVSTLVQLSPAAGAPADIFSSPAPTLGADPPKARDIKDGDASVSTQTGALQYTYPIQVPPGRNGVAPTLALTYSSQAPTYGGIAAGWAMEVPAIREDSSRARLSFRSWFADATQTDALANDRFVSSLAGGRPLVKVNEPLGPGVYGTYRAQNDTSFARYQRMATGQSLRWRVLTTDGTVMTFGDSAAMFGIASPIGTCAGLVSDQYAPLTRVEDSFGNAMVYEYEQAIPGECRLKRISWGYNTGAGITDRIAEVTLAWTRQPTCTTPLIDPGSQRDLRTGLLRVTGASKLLTITALAFAPHAGAASHTRQISLSYDRDTELCTRNHAPVRLLTAIQESAWGVDAPRVDLPAITFTYGAPSTELTTPVSTTVPWADAVLGGRRNNLAWGYRRNDDRWPTVEEMMIDLDGDGLLDRLSSVQAPTTGSITSCRARWQKNLGEVGGVLQFATQPNDIALPRLKWRGTASDGTQAVAGGSAAYRGAPSLEGCSLNGQVTAYRNSNEQYSCHVAPGQPLRSCTSATDPLSAEQYCFPGGTECPAGAGGPAGGDYRTYLAYRWLDMDADGLVDLVAAPHGDIDTYDIERGTRVDGNADYRNGEPAISGIPGVGQWPGCPGDQDRCKDLGNCMDAARVCTEAAGCTIDWSIVNTCLGQPSTTLGCFAMLARPGPGGGNPAAPLTRAPYARCEGLYPWLIYRNRGNGVFATEPTIKYQPIPLESDTGDSAITGPGLAAQQHAVMDFDGDGQLDAIAHGKTTQTNSNPDAWQVWLGDGTGQFGPRRYIFPTRRYNDGFGKANLISSSGTQPGGDIAASSTGLFDLNADGLLDHWMLRTEGNVNVALNDGVQHQIVWAGLTGEVNTPVVAGDPLQVKTGNDASHTITLRTGNNQPLEGSSSATIRTLDLDLDGRLDVVRLGATPVVHYNAGGQLLAAGYASIGSGQLQAFQRRTVVSHLGSPGSGSATVAPEESVWELKADLVDLDGDGIAEATIVGTDLMRYKAAQAGPPRLLRTVSNGQGLTTSVVYAHMHDASTVTQSASSMWPDVPCPGTEACRPKASPHQQWVVKSVTTTDTYAATTAVTTQSYDSPRFGRDDEGRHGFRGFERVTTTAPSGARTEQRYGYAVDWSGRLEQELVYPAVGPESSVPGEVRSLRRTVWEPRSLFGGAVTTYHAVREDRYTCSNGQTEAVCAATPAGLVSTLTTLKDYASHSTGGAPLLWHPVSARVQAQLASADGDRVTSSEVYVHSDATTYRVRPTSTTRQQQVGGALVTFGKAAQTWDATYRVPLTDEVWLNGNDADRAIGQTEYDLTTGNVVRRRSPAQVAVNGPWTELAYDPHKLFVVSEVNPLGHNVTFGYEYGTGTKVLTDGPNQRTCVTGPGCPLDATYPLREQSMLKIDGLGRMRERWETFSTDASIYTLIKVETNTYTDTPVAGAGSSVLHSQLVDASSGAPEVWASDQTNLDGHGRPIKATAFVGSSAPANQITTYAYNPTGTLAQVVVPDPSVNTAATVAYTYTYDSLGRPLQLRRPDNATAANRSGVNLAYNGLRTTSTEESGIAGGLEAETERRADSFGRLVEVRERRDATTWAATTYEYGPDDLVRRIVDPQGVTTTLTHDLGGRRTEIARHGAIWSYGYDRNGNLISEVAPGWSLGQVANYTTTIAYDAIDRPLSKLVGPRALSVADQDRFGGYQEAFVYDTGNGMKGRLRSWTSYGRSGGVVNTATYTADAQGNPVNTTAQFQIPGSVLLTRSIFEYWAPHGPRRYVETADNFWPDNYRTHAKVNFDPRGLPSKITIDDAVFLAGTLQPRTSRVISQERNVAGLVITRSALLSPGTIVSNWAYDALGRVTDQHIRKLGKVETTVARQQLTYLGNDNPGTLTHTLGNVARAFTHTFDHRHQLTGVSTSTAGYFTGTYQYGVAGRFTRATEARSLTINGSELRPRDVTYVYGGADPEQVTQLTIASGAGVGTAFATYSYDAAGNMLTRTTPGESVQFVYDGKDQLRRVTKGSLVEEYWYDHEGTRTQLRRQGAGVWNASTNPNGDGVLFFLKDVEARYSPTGTTQSLVSHISLGTPVARVERTSTAAPAFSFQFHGLASNSLASVDVSGTVKASFTYSPFGTVLETVGGATAAHRRRFNDKFADVASDLSYYGARYYDRLQIGWTQADPLYLRRPDMNKLSSSRRLNLYSFTLNNPLRYIDPDGHEAKKQVRMTITDLSRSQSKFERKVARITRDTLIASAQAGGANGLDRFIRTVSQGKVTFDTSSSNPPAPGKGFNFYMTSTRTTVGDLEKAGVDPKLHVGGGAKTEDTVGATFYNHDKITLNLDKLVEVANGLDLSDPEDFAAFAEYIETVAMHEIGHAMGLCHHSPCKSDSDRERIELMDDSLSLSSRRFRALRQSDFDTMMSNLEARVR